VTALGSPTKTVLAEPATIGTDSTNQRGVTLTGAVLLVCGILHPQHFDDSSALMVQLQLVHQRHPAPPQFSFKSVTQIHTMTPMLVLAKNAPHSTTVTAANT